MTNAEKYKDELLEIIKIGKNFAVEKESGKLIPCYRLLCNDCLLKGSNCVRKKLEWLLSEYEESEVDWANVKVDTPILVSDDGKEWSKRYFARFVDGEIYTWECGATSWSVFCDEDVTWWRYMKLAEEEEEE